MAPLPERSQEPSVLPEATELSRLTLYGLYPGMAIADVRGRLGEATTIRTYAECKQWWTSAGYDSDRELPFLLGFDTTYTFSAGDRSDAWWDIYTKGDRIVLAKGAVGIDDRVTDFGFPPTCFVGADESQIGPTLGVAQLVQTGDRTQRRWHHFLRQGVTVMTEDNRIKVLDLYAPQSQAKSRELAEIMRDAKPD